jgi:hypothetical protein
MSSLETRLIKIMESEREIYREIHEIKLAEHNALLAFSFKALVSTNQDLDRCTAQALSLEGERRSVAIEMARVHGTVSHEPTLRELAPYLDPASRTRLEAIARQITSTCVEIGKLQFTNSNIIERSLKYIRDLVESILRKVQFPPVAYNPTGILVSGKDAAPGILDRTV